MKRKRGSGFKDNSNLDKTFKTIKNMEKYDHMGATTKETTETKKPPSKDRELNSKVENERIIVLVQALKLVLRHLDGRSNLKNEELKSYIKTVLKVY